MPLVARHGDQRVEAEKLSWDAWSDLVKDNRHRWHLLAPCCDKAVVCKVSPLGTRFFAHKSGTGCVQESPLHLAAKVAVTQAARAAGWIAELELASLEGGWRADVLLSKGQQRIAVEIQTSPVKLDEVLRRQTRYATHGIRGVWLVAPESLMTEREDLPVFRLHAMEDGEMCVDFHPRPAYPRFVGSPRKAPLPGPPAPTRLALSEFVNRLLSDKIQWAPWLNHALPVDVYLGLQQCKGCSSLTRFVSGVVVRLSKKWPGVRDALLDWGAIYQGGRANELLQAIKALPFGTGGVANMHSKTNENGYLLSQRCPHCGRGLSAPYSMSIKPKDKLWSTVPLKLSGHWHPYTGHDTDSVPIGWWTEPVTRSAGK